VLIDGRRLGAVFAILLTLLGAIMLRTRRDTSRFGREPSAFVSVALSVVAGFIASFVLRRRHREGDRYPQQ
jgi:hypothetical protein